MFISVASLSKKSYQEATRGNKRSTRAVLPAGAACNSPVVTVKNIKSSANITIVIIIIITVISGRRSTSSVFVTTVGPLLRPFDSLLIRVYKFILYPVFYFVPPSFCQSPYTLDSHRVALMVHRLSVLDYTSFRTQLLSLNLNWVSST